MEKRIKIIASLLLFFTSLSFPSGANAQELNCQVSVTAPSVGSDQQVYTQMQEAITKYLNFQKWTNNDKYEPYERIKARVQIIIQERPTNDYFRGIIQVQVIRPSYNSAYESVLLNVQDKYFNVNFVPFQDLQFNENAYQDNLTSILNYYAYMILGANGDSFEMGGGSEYFQKARVVVTQAATSPETGWRNTDGGGNKNRYWLADNFVNNSYKVIHTIYYNWHRLGLDAMEKDVNKGRVQCMAALRELQKLNIQNPGLYVVRAFLDAKGTEIVEMFKGALVTDKRQVLSILEQIDPGNMNEYNKLNEEK
jgi:Domain of unknown function (DUF4835)